MTSRNSNYPLDLCAGLDYTRDSGLKSVHPYPYAIGWVSGILPLADGQMITGTGMVPWGTLANETAGTFLQAQFPNLQKTRG